jgi:hypothetical protein
MPSFTLCIDFALFPDNTPIPSGSVLGGFTFTAITPPPPSPQALFVNQTAGEKGLQFRESGMVVKVPSIPLPVRKVSYRLGAFAGPVKVEALGPTGGVVFSASITAVNVYANHIITVNRPKRIARLRFTGGHGEGILVKVCAHYA